MFCLLVWTFGRSGWQRRIVVPLGSAPLFISPLGDNSMKWKMCLLCGICGQMSGNIPDMDQTLKPVWKYAWYRWEIQQDTASGLFLGSGKGSNFRGMLGHGRSLFGSDIEACWRKKTKLDELIDFPMIITSHSREISSPMSVQPKPSVPFKPNTPI